MAIEQIVPGYDILNKVCEGSSSTIYHALRLRDGVEVALKVLKPELALDRERLNLFQREARMLQEFGHPNIVRVYSLIENGLIPVIEMEYFEGESIRSLFGRGAEIPYLVRLKIAGQLASALAYLHEREVIHRDVRLENLLLSEFYETRLIGFSCACKLKELKWQKILPFKRRAVESSTFLAPEEVRGELPGLFTDVYYCGATLYVLFTEKAPFPISQRSLSSRPITEPIVPPRKYCKEMSEEVEKIITKMLEKETSDRFPDMQTVSGVLSTAIERDIYRDTY
jgi:serine/threonine-protein kinase